MKLGKNHKILRTNLIPAAAIFLYSVMPFLKSCVGSTPWYTCYKENLTLTHWVWWQVYHIVVSTSTDTYHFSHMQPNYQHRGIITLASTMIHRRTCCQPSVVDLILTYWHSHNTTWRHGHWKAVQGGHSDGYNTLLLNKILRYIMNIKKPGKFKIFFGVMKSCSNKYEPGYSHWGPWLVGDMILPFSCLYVPIDLFIVSLQYFCLCKCITW